LSFGRALCAVDFSEQSRQAVAAALHLTAEPVLAVHVLDMPHFVHPRMLGLLGSEDARPISEIARETAERRLAEFVAQFDDSTRIVPVVLVGAPADTLLRYAEQEHADVIFVGTQGDAPLSKRLLGRVANHVVRSAHCMVVTVPPKGLLPLERMLVATDFSPAADAALVQSAELCSKVGAKLEVLHIAASPLVVPADLALAADPLMGPTAPVGESMTWFDLTQRAARQEMDRLEDVARRRGILLDRCRIEFGNPAAKVLEALEHGEFQLVAVGTHGRRGIARLMLGSVAESITHHAEVPVLIVHQRESSG
jgi:nucleotide-binding universal stress UspA family protein